MTSSIKRLTLGIALAASVLAFSISPAAAQDPEAPSIAEVATEDGRFTTLVTALGAAGLADTFTDCDGGPFTVLAPTDDAFTAALAALNLEVGDLVADADLLTSILTYHVIEGAVESSAVLALDGAFAPSLQGENLGVAVSGDTISITNGNPTSANVILADVQACNGIIHAIDNVLLPPSVAAALGLDAADDEELAITGTSSGLLTLVAMAMLTAGAIAVYSSRRLRLNG